MSRASDLTQLLQQLSESKTIGLALIDPQTLQRFDWNPDRRFPLGSVAKLLLAVATLQTAEGTSKGETVGGLPHLVQDAISRHSGDATGHLFDMVGGPEAVNLWLQSRGLAAARVAANQRDPEANSATPKVMARFLHDLLGGRPLQRPGQELVLQALAAQTDPDGMLQGLPGDARWAHMTGGFEGVCNDVGILSRYESTLVCCVFVQGDPHGDWEELRETVGHIGHIVGSWF